VALAFPGLILGGQPTAQEIVRLSISATKADWKATAQFSYVERDEDVKRGISTSKTYRVWMLDGSPYSRLIAVEGEPLSPAQQSQECQRLRKEIARRTSESSQERARRLEGYQKDRGQRLALLDEMAGAFDFRLLREQKLAGRDVYVFAASPRPGYQPKSWETRILTGMEGTLWVDKNSYQWVKVEAVAVRPVWLGWFVAKVYPGTRFFLEQTPVATGLWLPERYSFAARARILWRQKDYRHSETYTGYQRLSGSLISQSQP
jgi:hypothetical protein